MGMFTEEPMFEDPNLPPGWYRKVVQRQTGATAGQWDVYVYNPDGKKFRSRNELRTHLLQTASSLNSDDFDFSVKGKAGGASASGGGAAKGKSPTKKSDAAINRENSKENQQKEKKTPAAAAGVSKRSSAALNRQAATPVSVSERPKRELRKRAKTEPAPPPPPPAPRPATPPLVPAAAAAERVGADIVDDLEQPHFDEEEDEDDVKAPVANVKLKVKMGYTPTGAMIRPAANGSRKKKRRFRNLNPVAKKAANAAEPAPKIAASTSSTASGGRANRSTTAPASVSKETKNEKSTPSAGRNLRPAAASAASSAAGTTSTAAKKRTKSLTEPVAGPSGLQKVKRSPRRVLKRKASGAGSASGAGADDLGHGDDDDSEDDEYLTNLLYNTAKDPAPAPPSQTLPAPADNSDGVATTDSKSDHQKKLPDATPKAAEDSPAPCLPTPPPAPEAPPPQEAAPESQEAAKLNGGAPADVGPMVAMEDGAAAAAADASGDAAGDMQVVVIGDSVEDLHNYAKPHAL